jgi:hypothetical protein
VPTLEEALEVIRDKLLFTGPWEQHLTRRKTRVRDILRFMARTFDAAKCAQGSVNVGKYDAWAAERFPRGLTGRRRRDLTPDGEVVERGAVTRVSSEFLALFLAICEFALVVQKNHDHTLPHKRAKALWNALYVKGLIGKRFCARKWAVCREAMVRHGVIRITNRSFGPGHAMQWSVGPYFPFLGLWKERNKTDKQPQATIGERNAWLSQQCSSVLATGWLIMIDRTTTRHNTLLHKQPARNTKSGCCRFPRPPPSADALAHV